MYICTVLVIKVYVLRVCYPKAPRTYIAVKTSFRRKYHPGVFMSGFGFASFVFFGLKV